MEWKRLRLAAGSHFGPRRYFDGGFSGQRKSLEIPAAAGEMDRPEAARNFTASGICLQCAMPLKNAAAQEKQACECTEFYHDGEDWTASFDVGIALVIGIAILCVSEWFGACA